ncbi:MAG: AsmA family protein [Magnetovibrio sp.]|nr:AsmA family protein [Magnetovibrio sp.]
MSKGIKIVSVIGVLLIAVVVAGVVVLKSIDFNQYKGLIAEQAKSATGRDLKIAGDLNLEISLTPRVAVEGVSFANAAWGSKPEMVTVKRFAAEMSLIPLLSGNINIHRGVLEGVELLAEKAKDGKANWEFGAAKPAEKKDDSGGGDVTLPVVKSVSVKDVKVTYKDAQAGAEYAVVVDAVDLTSDSPSAPLNLNVKGSLNGQVFTLGGQVGSIEALASGGMFPVKLDIAALAANIGLDGQAGVPGGAPKADIKLALKGAKLADTMASAAAVAPALKSVELPIGGAYHVNAQVKLDGPQKIALENLDFGLGPVAMKGRLAANLSGARPAVDAALATDTLNLDELLPKGEAKAAPAKKGADDGRVFPNDPLPLDGLKAADAKVKFDAKKIIAQGMEVSDLSVTLNLKNGRLQVNPLGAGFGGGKINGDVVVDASKPAAGVKAKIGVKQVDYGMVLEQKGLKDMAQGKVDVDVDVTGAGNSVRQIMAGLNGKTRVVTKDGRRESGALNIVSTDLLNVFDSQDDKKIICGVVHFDIKKGMADGRAVVFETGGISVVGVGGANLANETINLKVDPRAKKANLATAVMVPVTIKGTFAKPDWEIDAAAAAGNVAAGAARTVGAISTLGLSLLAEKVVKSTVAKTDENDYCGPALAGKKVVPGKMAEAKIEEKPASGSGGSTTTESAPAKTEEAPSNPVEGISKGLKSLFGN